MPFQFVLFLLTVLFDKKRRLLHYNGSLLCLIMLGISPLWKIKLEGKEHLDRSKSHVVIMNHQSQIDIPLSFRLFYPFKMMGKSVLGFVPIIGWNLVLAGHILVDRSSTKSQFGAIRRMEALLQTGDSIFAFPEGTRSRDGEIAEFKKGAFRSAAHTGTPLLPVVIDGPFKILPKGSFICKSRQTITMRVLPPIPVEKGASLTKLAVTARETMAAELKEMRNNSSSD